MGSSIVLGAILGIAITIVIILLQHRRAHRDPKKMTFTDFIRKVSSIATEFYDAPLSVEVMEPTSVDKEDPSSWVAALRFITKQGTTYEILARYDEEHNVPAFYIDEFVELTSINIWIYLFFKANAKAEEKLITEQLMREQDELRTIH